MACTGDRVVDWKAHRTMAAYRRSAASASASRSGRYISSSVPSTSTLPAPPQASLSYRRGRLDGTVESIPVVVEESVPAAVRNLHRPGQFHLPDAGPSGLDGRNGFVRSHFGGNPIHSRCRHGDLTGDHGHHIDPAPQPPGDLGPDLVIGLRSDVDDPGQHIARPRREGVHRLDHVQRRPAGGQLVVDQDNGPGAQQQPRLLGPQQVAGGMGMRLGEVRGDRNGAVAAPGGVQIIRAQLVGDEMPDAGGGFGKPEGEQRLGRRKLGIRRRSPSG